MSQENEPSQEDIDAAISEEEKARRAAEEQRRREVREVLRKSGIVRSEEEIVTMRETANEDPLAGLEEEPDTEVPLDMEEEEEEDPPLRRTGSGPFVEEGKERAEAASESSTDDPWERFVPGLGKVRATGEHREIYEETFLKDGPLVLPINLTVGDRLSVQVIIRSLSVYESDVITYALKAFMKGHPLEKSAMAEGAIREFRLRAFLLLSVMAFGEERWDPVRVLPQDGVDASEDPMIPEIVRLTEHRFREIQPRKFEALRKARHMFDVITAILDDGEINGDFTDPVGFA